MINPDNRLFCRLDGLSAVAREQQRAQAIEELGLLDSETVPVFEEAIQTAAHFLEMPICILSLIFQDLQYLKAAVGLSRLGLMNDLTTTRQLSRVDSLCGLVVDSHQVLVLPDTLADPAFANSLLTTHYRVRAYLGVPLMTSNNVCIGTLAVLDLVPRQFTERDIEYLELTARWSMSEFERRHVSRFAANGASAHPTHTPAGQLAIAHQLQVDVLAQLTQELRTPLTSVLGMASVLTREIYGPLTGKQKEYIEVIHTSGQYLLSLVNEILELSEWKNNHGELNLISVDIEMLCQQAINTLEQTAKRREQEISLSIEPGQRIWLLDKDKIRQLIYHLLLCLIRSSNAGSVIRLHVSHRRAALVITAWVTHPWLDEGLSYADLHPLPVGVLNSELALCHEPEIYATPAPGWEPYPTGNLKVKSAETADMQRNEQGNTNIQTVNPPSLNSKQRDLGLLLTQQLVEIHGGKLAIHRRQESGYRYVVTIPQIQIRNMD
jgi:signal transduction histidine kinase